MKQTREMYRRLFSGQQLASLLMLVALFSAIVTTTGAQGFVEPGKNIEVIGVPPISASLAREVKPYSGIYGLPLAQWDPTKLEILLKGLSSSTWISRVASPGGTPVPTSILYSIERHL